MRSTRHAILKATVCAGALASSALPASATFHLAQIVEIMTGTAGHPDHQYVVIMPYANNQAQFSGVEVTVFDAAGNPLPLFATFASNLPGTGTDQRSILVATSTAQTILGILPEQVASGSLPASGLICFRKGRETRDCVSYGQYMGDTNAGGSPAGPPAPAHPSGWSLRRSLGPDETLQATDDSNDSAADFFVGAPRPENFGKVYASDLRLSKAGTDVELSWVPSPAVTSFTVHKTDTPSTVLVAAPVATVGVSDWPDPDPGQFPGLTCYVVKP